MTSSPDLAAELYRAFWARIAHPDVTAFDRQSNAIRMMWIGIAEDALLALAGDTSGGGGEIDVSACADSSDAPAFGAAGDAQRKSEGGAT